MFDWQKVSIEALAAPGKNSLATGPFGSAIGSRFFREKGVPVIRGSNLSLDVGKRLVDSDVVFVDESKAEEFSRSVARRGDLIFTCWGTIGQIGLVDERSRFDRYIVSNKQMKLTPNSEMVDSLFLYYALSSPGAVAQVQGASIGSSVPGFNLTQLRKVEVPLPPLVQQQSISSLLGALDDKIAVNERIVSTADKLALMLASLEQWDARVPLSEICDLNKIQQAPQEMSDEFVDHYSLPAYDDRKMPERCSPQSIRSGKFVVDSPAVLLSKLNPEIRRVWDVDPETEVPALASTEFLVLIPHDEVSTHDLWSVVAQESFLRDLAAKVTGTSKSHQRVRPAEVMAAKVVDPRQFGDVGRQIRGLAKSILAARRESMALRELRDALLPQLMSGRLRVKDAEKLVEDVT
ncbi:restriction endonuclease subunit S [Glycomyces luteolus]|uniref:Restriction endonuclease subunit S n=1 Tax=Glycomyces luteolus TaxID=2670330 RepID=A0A9X3PBT7_9ACTN|nr:restriction endonuclease subunit S [Glycomyces luteolus]MDA1362167.1 restriction endonuclease subunit S [Glycomyces luteolus]